MNLSFVRAVLFAVLATVMLLGIGPTLAAPTCQDRHGLTIRCGTEGTMPVGWSLPFEERKFESHSPTTGQLLHLIATLGLLFALIALLPEFDGRRSRDWGRQEDDS